jgi:AraC-like DNA-binding protein
MIDGVARGWIIPPPGGETPCTWVVHQGNGYRVGAVRIPPRHPRWERVNWIPGLPILMFPRQPIRIRLLGGGGGMIDAGCAVYFASEERYRCEPAGDAGDRSDWFALSPELLARLAPGLELEDLRTTRITVRPHEFELQRCAFRHALVAPEPDDLLLEEALCRMLGLLHSVREMPRRGLAEDLKALLAVRYRETLRLDDLAAELHVSPNHLCREFRRETGTTIHGHRELLRLAEALDHFERPCDDLTGLALDLGYSSHAHFSANFKRVLGTSPSRLRAAIRQGRF